MEELETQIKELIELGGLWDSAESLVGSLVENPSGLAMDWIASVLQQFLFVCAFSDDKQPSSWSNFEQLGQMALTVLAQWL